MTVSNSKGMDSFYFLGSNADGSLLVFGEETHFEILNGCELLLFDATFDSSPSFGNKILYDAQWIIHGVKESHKAGIASESFPTISVLMAKGKGNHREEDYSEALTILFKAENEHGYDLSDKAHRGLADFETAERNGVLSKFNIITNKMECCGYHWVGCYQNGLKDHNLWEGHLNDYDFWKFNRTFMAMRDVPERRVHEAYNVMTQKINSNMPRKYRTAFTKFLNEYFVPTWMNGRYEISEWNGYRKQTKANNFAETQNWRIQCDVGVHEPFYLWLYKMKKYSAKTILKWNRFKENGFERNSSIKEHTKLLGLKKLWDKVGDRRIELFEYMEGVSLLYSCKWTAFDKRFGSVDVDDDEI